MNVRTAIFASLLMAAVASATHGAITVSLIDTGAPQVPTFLSPSGYMEGYTGFILRLTSDGDPATTWDFGPIPGSAISGNFAQIWTGSSGAGRYTAFTPGLSDVKNDSPSIWNADSHFLGDPTHVNSSVVENGIFTSGLNSNPFADLSNQSFGYGVGTYLTGVVSLIGKYYAAGPTDIAYLVVPNTSPDIRFFNAQVVTTSLDFKKMDGFLVSSPTPPSNSDWVGTAGGSWNDASRWTAMTNYGSFKVSSAGGTPHQAGDMARFESFTKSTTVTLDGNKTLSFLSMNFTDLRPGTGGVLTFDNLGVFSTILTTGSQVNVPIHLKNDIVIDAANFPSTIASDISEEPGRPASLTVRANSSLTLLGNNTYTAGTRIYGSLVIGDGTTLGTIGDGPIVISPGYNGAGRLTFRHSDTYILNNPVSGNGQIIQDGPGTLILAGYNTFTGKTTTLQGTLIVQNPGSGGGSGNVLIGPGAIFSNWVTPQGKLSNIGATSTAGLQTQANLRAGTASSQVAVTLSFRPRDGSEQKTLVSDVITISGMTRPATTQTDPFTLEMSYDQSLLANESLAASKGQIYLGWLSDADQWVNAVDGNFDTGFTVIPNFQGSWAAFAAAFGVTDGNVGNYLGSWGVDTSGNTTWAILNHNSQYSVAVPEPASVMLLACAGGLLVTLRSTRRR